MRCCAAYVQDHLLLFCAPRPRAYLHAEMLLLWHFAVHASLAMVSVIFMPGLLVSPWPQPLARLVMPRSCLTMGARLPAQEFCGTAIVAVGGALALLS